MRLLTIERITSMSEHEKKEMIDKIKSSNLTVEEKEENLKLLMRNNSKEQQILKDIKEGEADLDDIGGSY